MLCWLFRGNLLQVTTELSCQKANNEVVATAKPQKDALIPRTGKTEAREDVLKPRLALSRGNWIHSESCLRKWAQKTASGRCYPRKKALATVFPTPSSFQVVCQCFPLAGLLDKPVGKQIWETQSAGRQWKMQRDIET